MFFFLSLQMISLVDFFSFFFFWWPWFDLISYSFIVQISLVYTLYLLFNSKNVFYTLLYLFLFIFLLGLFLCFIQMELFCGFLWVVEFTVIFVAILLILYLNVEGSFLLIDLFFNKFYFFYFFLFLFFFIFFISFNLDIVNSLVFWLNFDYILEDYYEALANSNSNDFFVLTIGYYSINSLEFILIGFILLVGTLLCVSLNSQHKMAKLVGVDSQLSLFSYFKDFFNFFFLRKQNLNNQVFYPANLRVFNKKKF